LAGTAAVIFVLSSPVQSLPIANVYGRFVFGDVPAPGAILAAAWLMPAALWCADVEDAMADIFLSYAKEDRTRAQTIAAVIESCGWSVFWDRKITAGQDWRQIVQSELDSAGVVVVLWSHASAASTWVHEEAERGRTRLVSVLIDDAKLPLGFTSLQAIDLIGWQGGRVEDVGKLINAIAEVLRRPPLQRPRIPKSPKQKLAMAAVAGLVMLLAASVFIYRSFTTPSPIMNQEIVLDTSMGMKDDFEGKPSKLVAAVEALHKRIFPREDNLALRTFGGTCNQDDESRLLVRFGTNRRGRIESASSGLVPRGEPTLASAVISALTDVQPLPHTRRIVVLTGHADVCSEEAIREIKQRFEAQPKASGKTAVELEMRFIGLAVSAKDTARIQQISDTVGGQAYFVSTVAELNDVLQYVLEFEPAVAHVRRVWSIVDEVGKSMTGVAQNMNEGKTAEATAILDSGQALYANMRPSFDSLAGLQPSVNFQRFYKLAAENRSLQDEGFAAGRAWIRGGALSKDTQSPGYESAVKKWNELVGKWNEIVGKYNANINEMNALTNEIVNQMRRKG
jgi:hypothetical protein